MSSFTLSASARADLLEIAEYTLQSWGEQLADKYLNDLESCCRLLSDNPMLGRQCDGIRAGLRRMEHREHVVFYAPAANGLYVVRILHRSMLPTEHDLQR